MGSEDIYTLSIEKYKEMAAFWNQWNAGNLPIFWDQAGAYQKRRLEMCQKMHDEMVEEAMKRTPKIVE